MTSVTNELTKVWNLTLNANGWRTQLVDPNSHTNQYAFDHGGSLTYWTNALQQVVQYQYDALQRLTNIVDGRTNSLGFVFASRCEPYLTQISYGTGDSQNFGYDPAGNLLYFTNRIGQVVTNTYDAVNQLTQKVYVSASDVITCAYDAAHQLTNMVWTQGASTTNSALSLAYDAVGRVTNETSVVGSAAALTVSYQYYDDGRRKQLTYPDSTNVTYDYYDSGWLKDIKDGGGNAIVTYYYDAAGHCTNKTLLNNTYTVYGYDAAGHLTGLTNYYGNGSVICGYTYGYDSAGNRSYVKRSTGLGDVYTYDAADQLTKVTYQATNPDGSPGAGTNQVVYVIDTAGNWSSVTNIIPSTSTNSTTYQVNSLNQYTNIGNQTYYYTNGNYWKNSSNSFFYDYESRLICSFVGGITITNVYDGLGRHVGRKHSAIWTRYYYAGWQLIEERDRTGNVAANYVCGGALDEPIRMARNGTNYYYHTDGLGSITAITDGNGALIEQYSYDVYGMPTIYDGQTNVISSSAISNPWMFQGRYWEPDALLYNYRFRYYHPGMRRFMQVDPLIDTLGSVLPRNAPNLYSFIANNPLNGYDPLGLYSWRTCYWANLSINGKWWQKPFANVLGVISAAVPDSAGISFNTTGALGPGVTAGGNYQAFFSNPDTETQYYDTTGVTAATPQSSFSIEINLAWSANPPEQSGPASWTGWFSGYTGSLPIRGPISGGGSASIGGGWFSIGGGIGIGVSYPQQTFGATATYYDPR